MSINKKSKTKKRIIIAIIVIVIVGIAAVILMRPATTTYESVQAKTGDITTYYSFSGNVETKNRQTVISENIMQIAKIKVKEGDLVKAGDVLLTTTAGNEITAKITGEVANTNVTENAPVMTGVTLMEIVDYNSLEIKVKVDEYDLAALATGKETTVTIGAIGKELKGTISSVSKEGQVVNGVAFFIATIDLEQDGSVKIGMSAEVKLISGQATGVVTLPMTAIQFDENNQPYVLKKDAKGLPVKTAITTGINNGTTVEVKSGVSSGETILYTKAASTAGNSGFMGGGDTTSTGIGGGAS